MRNRELFSKNQNMKRVILLVLCVCVFSACTDRFSEYQTYRSAHIGSSASGSAQPLRGVQDYELLITPIDSVDDRVLSYIAKAHDFIDLNVYMLTHKSIIQALVDAESR